MGLDIGIDLGTTKIIVYKHGKGILLKEPSVVAVNTLENKLVAVGDSALRMLGKTPGYIKADYPLKDGVISDHVLTEVIIKDVIKRSCNSFFMKPRIIICTPSVVTDVEKMAIVEAVAKAGARKVYLIEEPIAAAIGAGIDITKPNGHCIVDIGGGTADVAVTSLAGVVLSQTLRYAGNRVDDEIMRYFTNVHHMSIGKKTAEQLKKNLACVYHPDPNEKFTIKGRDLLSGYPKQLEVSQTDIYECVIPFGEEVVRTVRNVLENTPPELSSDLYENGIIMTGGGSLMKGLDELLSEATKLKCMVAENPIECVSIGTGKAFDYIDMFHSGFSNETTYIG